MGVGIKHVNAEEVVAIRRRGNAALIAPVDGHAADRHVGIALDGNDRVFVRPSAIWIRSVGNEKVRIRRFDNGLATASAEDADILAVDRHLLAVSPRRDQDGVAADRRVDRGLDGGVAAVAHQQEAVGGVVDLLDAGENVGALPTRRDHLPARLVAAGHRIGVDNGRDVGRGQRAGVGRRIGARIADERVVAAAAGENVVAGIAGDDVGVVVAGAVDVAAAGQGQVLDVGAERVADRRLHGVGAAAHSGGFRHHVAGVVDDIGVVAVATGQGVRAHAAVEGVVAAVAGDDIGVAVAGAVDV